MNLYKISQTQNDGYDTYDSAIVAAYSAEGARLITPQKTFKNDDSWAEPEHIKVKLIGVAVKGTKSGVILASFNAG